MIRTVKKMMALLSKSKNDSNAEARIAIDPEYHAKKSFVKNKTILAKNDRLIAKCTSQSGAAFVLFNKGTRSPILRSSSS